jgi:hypothetical protein
MRIAIGTLVLLSVVIAGLLLTQAFLRRQLPVAVRPNGARIELLGAAPGKTEFSTEKAWHRTARQWLPAALTKSLPPAYSSSCYGGSNGVTFYFRVTDPTATTRGWTPWSSYSAEDETGFRFDQAGGNCSSGSGAGTIYGLIVPAIPRRQAAFKLNFHDSAGQVLATLQVANPVRGPFPKWQPEPLPQAKTNGAVTLMLEAMKEEGNARWSMVAPRWKITASDPAWAMAKVRHATFYDATGNEGMHLSPRESAWKARALVFRERPDSFSSEERFVITNLSVPAAGNFIKVDQSAERLGVKLTAIALVGPGRIDLTNGVGLGVSADISTSSSTYSFGTNRVESWGGPRHFLLLEAQNVQPDDEILMRIVDEQGSEIKLPDSGGYNGRNNGARMYKRNFTPPAETKSLSLEVIVNRPLAFEFMVNPAEVHPKSPATNQ